LLHAEGDTLVNIQNVAGSSPDDNLYGNDVSNTLFGDAGDDWLTGNGGVDTLLGYEDDDQLDGGIGGDTLDGGLGNDTAFYGGSDEAVHVNLNTGIGIGGDASGDTFISIENLTGSGHDDYLAGNDDDNVLGGQVGQDDLYGLGGADTLWGFMGDDYLDGGAGFDLMIGGFGNDTYVVDHFNDSLIENSNQGIDVVLTSIGWTLPAGASIETLRTTDDYGTTVMVLQGNSYDNEIIGNDGHNTINGHGGADHMVGRDGNDIYYVDNVNDSVDEDGGDGLDAVWTSVSWTLTPGADVEVLQALLGYPVASLTGNSSGNLVVGNEYNNVINGGGGNDELVGLWGDDTFLFNTTLDPAVTNIGFMSDFNAADDTIHLDDVVFAVFANGPLADDRFVVGTAALDGNDNILYNNVTGALLYDSDGNGAAAAIQFASVYPGVALTHLDFVIV
jgi:Ca2+-binding RTX toxin-like protein